jgi:hypothetical protein
MMSQTWPYANGASACTVTYTYDVGGNPLVPSVSGTSGEAASGTSRSGTPASRVLR